LNLLTQNQAVLLAIKGGYGIIFGKKVNKEIVMLKLEKAKELIAQTTTQPHLILHAKNVMVAMGGLAEHFGEDKEQWMAVG
jgi:predicted hydrolase (HD superfamily)